MLSALIWVPLLGTILISLLPKSIQPYWYRRVALAIAIGLLAWTALLGLQFDVSQTSLQFIEDITWIRPIGLNYQLGLDGLSLPLLALNNLLTIIAILSSDRDIERPRFYYAILLFLSAGVTGAFLAQDLLLFFLFYELEIIPLYFLIAIWGGKRRGYAATKFLIYTAISGIFILASFLGLTWISGVQTFNYEILRSQSVPLTAQLLLLGSLLIGFGIKIPFFPLHTWLPDAHVEASTPISVLLAGVLLKLGTYGLLRFGVGLFLEAWTYLAPWLAVWAAVSALYGTSCAIAQTDMKRVVAYSSIAHMAFVLLALSATTRLSITAAVFQMVSHGLISALLFLLVGTVYKKTGSRDVNYLRGLLNPERGLPLTGSLMIMGVMASAGIPGMVGFIAEFLVFRGSFPIFPLQTLLCMVATGLTAVYFLLMINKVFFGRLPVYLSQMPPVPWSERIPAIALACLVLALGLQPNWMVRWTEPEAGYLLTGQFAAQRLDHPIVIRHSALPLAPAATSLSSIRD
ncbi:MAG: NADH-quinone oxidoreductase subunit M [Elainellaceae cyanobacterium]